MKRKFKILTFLLAAVVLFAACDEDERPYSEFDVTSDAETVIMVGMVDQVVVLPGGQPGEYIGDIYVEVRGKVPASDITVPFTLDATTMPTDWFTVGANQFVIPAGSNTAHIEFAFKLDSIPLDSVFTFDYTIGTPSAGKLNDWYSTTLEVFKACPISVDDFAGLYEVDVDGDVWEVTCEVVEDEDAQIVLKGVWLSVDSVFFNVAIPASLADPVVLNPTDKEQIIGEFGSYGRCAFEAINGGIVTNTCVPLFEFKATPTLPDAGLWWGGEYTFKFTKISDKGEASKRNLPAPFKF